ncbi:hypothetical protein A2716_04020 [candidate division WWE3 bacterium RIFCSPHIGHO2_01_FULL_40_23]|uniref:Holo-[acyl-carrier-protein] synthase n=1 Tax=candidate division WWE3 bacterium RIFCSPLOWO2_01_FULL_41_18 TaxID=1802625 RepID=A0A1F4VEB9_UNCKA|nr:MAG: hypothetical protein A2716_04020 [candidate division WWE3 bacterium RIFCSPHIGHO2_01_FULL_40_23]OGC55043.1 MAG: hypothetical protein A3A78_03630 [candidate division WWE3 bacterium RIFCSPLOWO2_01_FULL_41_18]
MKVGLDIQNLKKFKKSVERSGQAFLHKIFTKKELSTNNTDNLKHLCGIFCAKEALIKTGIIGIGDWLEVEILKDAKGKPLVYKSGHKEEKIVISISHSEDICAAVVIINK